MRSRLALTLALIITSGCTDPREPEPPCRCEGAVPGGTLELACGASTCVGGVGYRCDGPNRAATDPSACAPIEEDDAGTTPDGGADAGAPCRAETNARLCNDADLFCGPLETVDSCGEARSLSCGTCSAPDTCGGGGIPGQCGCVPVETDEALCAARGAECGEITARDSCGDSRTVVCGACATPETCGGGGEANACGCTPETDAELCSAALADCGTITAVDRCGATRELSCGSCAAPLSCAGGGTANRCGCTAESDAALCLDYGSECGPTSVVDACGVSRSVECGGCDAPDTCGGGGTANRCGCTPETDAALCAAAGATCGTLAVNDACGAPRAPVCGTCGPGMVCSAAHACAPYAEPFDPICSTGGWCWENPLPQGNDLNDVFARAANDVWVAGDAGTVLRWNGSRWSGWTGLAGDLNAVWADAAGAAWVVGDGGTVLRWNGSSFTRVDAGVTGDVLAVWGSAANDVWIGTASGLRRFDGASWSTVTIGTTRVLDLFGFAADDIWALGSGSTLHHWDGAAWTQTYDAYYAIYSIWGASPSDVWAVGESFYRWTGTTWSAASPPLGANGRSVWATSSTDVWVAGVKDVEGYLMGSHLYHFDGLAWTDVPVSLPYPTSFAGVGGAGGGAPLVVGEGGTMLRRVDDRWVSLQDGLIHRSQYFDDVSGTSYDQWVESTPEWIRAWMPPSGAPIVASPLYAPYWGGSSVFGGVFEQHAGEWTRTAQSAAGVWVTSYGTASETVWLMEPTGRVRQGVGGSWPLVHTMPSTTRLRAGIWAASASDVWAVKDDDTDHFDGTSWTSVPNPVSGTAIDLYDVWGASASDVFAVGTDRTVLRWNGTAWSNQVTPAATTTDLTAVTGRSGADVWIAGEPDALLHWNGATWSLEPAPDTARSVWLGPAGEVWMIGAWDGALHRRGAAGAWESVPVPVDRQLYCVTGRGDTRWVIGDDLAILRRD